MKKFIVCVAVAMLCVVANAQVNKTYTEKDGHYMPISGSTGRVPKDSIITQYTWKDYPIVVRKADGYAWVCRISSTSGKFRREAIPVEVAQEICGKLGIKYTYIKKTRNTNK